jgi:hypothetical protein
MQELINRLTEKAGITAEQATKSIETIKEFVKEKFPMLGGAVDNMFAEQPASSTGTSAQPEPETPKTEEHGILDKISDVIPGQTGEKIETFAKNAEQKVEDAFHSIKDKLGNMLGGDKK